MSRINLFPAARQPRAPLYTTPCYFFFSPFSLFSALGLASAFGLASASAPSSPSTSFLPFLMTSCPAGGLLFFDLQRHDVRQHALRLGNQLHLGRVNRQFIGAELFAKHQLADVHPEFRRDVRRQAFDFHFARHHFENSTLHLHAGGLAKGVYGNLHLHSNVHSHAQKIHMQQFPADGINQPIFQDRGFVLSAKIHLKKCVVPALGPENRADLLGVHRQCDGRALAAIQHRRHLARQPEPPRLVLPARLARRTFHYNRLCHVLLPFFEYPLKSSAL